MPMSRVRVPDWTFYSVGFTLKIQKFVQLKRISNLFSIYEMNELLWYNTKIINATNLENTLNKNIHERGNIRNLFIH